MATSLYGFVATSGGRDDRLTEQKAEGEEHNFEAFKDLSGWSE